MIENVFKIKIPPPEIGSFVQECNKYSQVINISCGNKVANAKSLMGVLSLDLNKTFTIVFYDLEYDKVNYNENSLAIKNIADNWKIAK